MLREIILGVIATLVFIGEYYLFVKTGLPPAAAAGAAVVIAVVVYR